MHCPITWVSIIFASTVSVPLVDGNQAQRECPLTPSDEIILLQVAANAKAKPASTQPRGPLCFEPEARLGFSADSRPEPLVVPLVPGSNAPKLLEFSEAAPAPVLVLVVRAVLSLLSLGFFINGAMRWTEQGHVAPTLVNTAVDAVFKTSQRSELHKAALESDDVRCESLLSQAVASHAAADNWGTTALHCAATSGAHVVGELLLEHGAPVDPTDAWDETPLHLAAREGHVKVCELLAKRGASLRAVNAENCTPLVVASYAGQEAVCRWLLAFGAGVEGLSEEELPNMLRELIAETTVEATPIASS